MRKDRGASLIVVIMAIIIIAILGWSLVNMQSSDFEIGWRSLESEKALGLAEAGIFEAMSLLKSGNTTFDNDTDTLTRKLGGGEYFLNRTTNGTEVTVTSTGYMPSVDNYRTKRRVQIVYATTGFMNAITGGQEFDWVNATTMSVEGSIVSERFNRDGDSTYNETVDVQVPPWPTGGDRLATAAIMPALNLTWYKTHPDTRQPIFTTDQKWSSYNGSPGTILYVEGNVIIDLTGGGNHNFNKASIVATGNITIDGNKNLKMTAHVNNPQNMTYPNLATVNGNIIVTNCTTGSHEFDGLTYTQNGVIDLRNVATDASGKAMAIMGKIIRLRGNIDVKCTQKKANKYIDFNNGFNVTGQNRMLLWKEQ